MSKAARIAKTAVAVAVFIVSMLVGGCLIGWLFDAAIEVFGGRTVGMSLLGAIVICWVCVEVSTVVSFARAVWDELEASDARKGGTR